MFVKWEKMVMSGVSKWTLRFIRFMVGLLIGFFVLISFISDNKDDFIKENLSWMPRIDVPGVPKEYSSWKIIWLCLVIMLAFLIFITLIARLMMTAESASGTAVILNAVADFFVGVPLTTAIWYLLVEFMVYELCLDLLNLLSLTNESVGMILLIIILSVVYAFVYIFACMLIDIFYYPWSLKPLRKKEKI